MKSTYCENGSVSLLLGPTPDCCWALCTSRVAFRYHHWQEAYKKLIRENAATAKTVEGLARSLSYFLPVR